MNKQIILLIFLGLISSNSFALDPVVIGFDGTYGLKGATSATAIERGAQIAIEEINEAGGVLNGRPLKLITTDNRMSPPRGLENLKQFAKDPNLVAVLGGRFSPVILKQLKLLHDLKIPLLDVWGSANGITDHDFQPSYTFRVSLKDDIAIPAMLNYARSRGLKKIGVLLINGTWGRSNHKEINRYVISHPDMEVVKEIWHYHGETNMLAAYNELKQAGAQAIIFIGTSKVGSALVRQMVEKAELPLLPIISHWGISGGTFFEQTNGAINKVDLVMVQTFSLYKANPVIRNKVMLIAKKLYDIDDVSQIKSPVGFGHAYDAVHILAKAIKIAGSTDRESIRNALEKVKNYQGLVRNYGQVFSAQDHDALNAEQVFMTRYQKDGVIVPLQTNE
ncbi:MAG: ABC transporter substrate-binding protein [Gammaproteobacteria bacterium]|nr:ABC transporter substrate-binding protein [Gammaproteobacteria bacterium]